MLNDYSEILEKNWSQVVRGKHYHCYPRDRQPVVRITDLDGVRFVKLTAQLDSDITPGDYPAILIIEEPTNQRTLSSTDENNGEEENTEHSS